MSVADTAEYQLSVLADCLNELRGKSHDRLGKATEPCDIAELDGYQAALDEVAREMGIKAKVVYHYYD